LAQSAQVIDKNTSTLGLLLGTRTAAPSIVVNTAWPVAAPEESGATRPADAASRARAAGLVLHEATNAAAAMAANPTQARPGARRRRVTAASAHWPPRRQLRRRATPNSALGSRLVS